MGKQKKLIYWKHFACCRQGHVRKIMMMAIFVKKHSLYNEEDLAHVSSSRQLLSPFFSALEYFDNNLFVFLFSGKLCCFYILNNMDATIVNTQKIYFCASFAIYIMHNSYIQQRWQYSLRKFMKWNLIFW